MRSYYLGQSKSLFQTKITFSQITFSEGHNLVCFGGDSVIIDEWLICIHCNGRGFKIQVSMSQSVHALSGRLKDHIYAPIIAHQTIFQVSMVPAESRVFSVGPSI